MADIESNNQTKSVAKVQFSRVAVAISAISLALLCAVAYLSSNSIEQVEQPQLSRSLRERKLIFGIADDRNVEERAEQIGVEFDSVVKYQDVKSLSYQWMVKPYLDKGKKVTMVLEFFSPEYRNLEKVAYGEYDKYLYSFIHDIKADGNRKFSIRPFHEFNGDWYSWGTYRGESNNTDSFKRAFRHVAEIFRKEGVNVDIQLDYNCENAGDDKKPFIEWYPGGDVVDIVMCNAYNRYGLSEWHNKWESFSDVFDYGYQQMLTLPDNKPLGVGETSTTGWGQQKADWFRDAINDLTYKYDRVEECDFFIINKGQRNWGLNSWDEEKVFGESIKSAKWLAGL